MNDLLRAVGTFTAACRDTKISPQFAQRSNAVGDRSADLAFGDAVADANVHVVSVVGTVKLYGVDES